MLDRVHVILQARTGSKRLYGKTLLPITEDPLVILCNKRLKNNNFKLTTIIPAGKEDDYLAYILKNNNINFFRGNKYNVLKRFKEFTKDLDEEQVIVRVTADNPFVDSTFINKLVKIYTLHNLKYLSAHDNIKNLPYGLQAEIFKIKYLRESVSNKKNVTEHVTTEIRKKYLNKYLKIYLKNYSGLSTYKLSIDTVEDLERVKKIFEYYKNSPYSNLVKILKDYKNKKNKNIKMSKVILGTVQLGKKYFIKQININQKRANKIMNVALKEKINSFDTARDYGLSEEFIGNFKIKQKKQMFIFSKLHNLDNLKNIKKEDLISRINFSIFESLNKLKSSSLEIFFVHNPKNLFMSKVLYSHLCRFLDCGIFKNLGVSIYNIQEFNKLKKYKKVKCIQIPFNLIDYKWIKILNKQIKNKKIFVRSVFIRGNLKKNNILFPKNFKNKFDSFNNYLNKICIKFNKKNLFELSISYLKTFRGINYFIIGAQNIRQVVQTVKYFKQKPLKKKQKATLIKLIQSQFDPNYSDLRNWN